MGTIAPPPYLQGSSMSESKKISVRLTGIDQRTSVTAFENELSVSDQPLVFRPDRALYTDQPIILNFVVTFPTRTPMRATANISGLKRMVLQLESARRLLVEISHSRSTRECHLVCLENGATSDGPCLTCPDGAYEVRICC
jgi:hypothetical protein